MLSDRFQKALVYASQVHNGQLRKGTQIPYLSHLLSVASIAMEYGANEDEAIGALLHDAGEDAGGDERILDIRNVFGDAVADIVQGCTDAVVIPKPPWQERKERYIAGVPHEPVSVRFVSAADKLHNVRSIIRDYRALSDGLWLRFKGGKHGSLWYYRALVGAYRQGTNFEDPVRSVMHSELIEELDRAMTELEMMAREG
ncbi:MAG: HD domain-containing protein [Bacteroidota bacterium]